MKYFKKCSKCKIEKSHKNFRKNKSKKDGLNSYCKLCNKLYLNAYLLKNSELDLARRLRYRSKRVTKDNRNRNTKNRYHSDLNFKLKCVLRSRLVGAIINNQKNGSAVQDLGCSITDLKLYIESKFKLGMSWDNWNLHGWHIDHIIPLSKFDLSDSEQCRKATHFSNLQPLWALDNIRKSDGI